MPEIYKLQGEQKKYKFTPKEYKDQRHASDAGAAVGFFGGGYGGYKAVQGARRVGSSTKAGAEQYKASRRAIPVPGSTNDIIGGHGRLKSAGAGVKTGAGALRRLPKKKVSLAPLIGAYVGALSGTVAGAGAAQKKVVERQKKRKDAVGKSASASAFGIDHG